MKNYLSSQLVIVLGLIVFPISTCLGADYYQFDIKEIPCLKSFTLASSEIEMDRDIVSRSLIVENSDDRVSIKLYRSLSDDSGEEAYKAQLWKFNSSKSPVDVGDEAVKIGLSAVVFKCGPYVGCLEGLSKHSRIAMGEVDGSTVVKLTSRDLRVHSDLVLSDLGSEIASAISEHSQNLKPLLVTNVQAEKTKLSTAAFGMSSTFIDVSAENEIGGSVAVFGQAENLVVDYVDNKLKVSMIAGKPGWQTLKVTAVNDALQVSTGSCRILVEEATGALKFDKNAFAVKPSSAKRARQSSWAKEVYEKGLKGEEAKAFFEAKLREHKNQATPKSK